jgi:hypothetical protein
MVEQDLEPLSNEFAAKLAQEGFTCFGTTACQGTETTHYLRCKEHIAIQVTPEEDDEIIELIKHE